MQEVRFNNAEEKTTGPRGNARGNGHNERRAPGEVASAPCDRGHRSARRYERADSDSDQGTPRPHRSEIMIKTMPNGKYRVRRIDSTGKKICRTFERRRKADAFETEMKDQMNKGEYIAPKTVPTFEAKSVEWFATLAGRRPGTVSNYRGWLDNWLLPRFRHERLDRIDTQSVEKFRAEIDAKTGRDNLRMIMAVLAQILKMAQRHDQIRI